MRRKQALISLVLVVALLGVSFGVLNYAQAQLPLAGANMVLPFARRSWITQPFHTGIDYRAGDGTAVVAAKYGQVATALDQWPDGWCFDPPPGVPADPGNYITIDHGGGYVTKYFHLQHNSFAVAPPNYYPPGTRIANSDTTGTTDGGIPTPPYCDPPAAHLHFQLEVNGTPTDPYAGSTHWAGGEPFPMGYRDQDNAIQGPFPLTNAKIRDRWVLDTRRLGSPTGNVIPYECMVEGVTTPAYKQFFERGYISYCGSGQATVQAYYTTYLPRLQATADASDWDAYVYIRNLTASPATVSITLLKTDGNVLDSRTYLALPGNATWQIRPATIINDWLIGGYNSFIGSAIVASDRDVAVVVRMEKTTAGVLRTTAYTGISTLNSGTGWGQPGTTVYAPALYWRPPWQGGSQWESTLHLQNTTSYAANFSLTYYRSDGTVAPCSLSNQALPAYGKADYSLSPCGSGFVGAAVVQSNRALAVVVSHEDASANYWGAMHYNAFSSGSTTVYLPSLFDNYYNWYSSFLVQNLGGSTATVRVTYYPESGDSITCPDFTLAPKASRMVCQFNAPPYPAGCGLPGCDFPDGQQGTAIITSPNGQLLVATVEQQLDNAAQDWRSAQSYSGLIGGGTTLYGPFAASHTSYDSCSHVQNLGSSGTVDCTSYYYRPDGTPAPGGHTETIAAGSVKAFYVPVEGVGTDFTGAVRLARTAGQNALAGIHNIARKPAVDDFGASYNMPQR